MKKKLIAALIMATALASVAFAGGDRETFVIRKNTKDGKSGEGGFNFYLDFGGKGNRDKSTGVYTGGKSVEESIEVSEKGSVRIQALTGNIRVTGVEGSGIFITGRIGDDIEKLNIEKKEDGSVALSLKWPARKNLAHFDLWCDLDIQVPAGYNVLVSALNADMKLSGMRGNLRLETASGEINVADCVSGLVRAQTLNGPFTLDGTADEVRFQTMNGPVTLRGNTKNVYGSSMDGDIRVEVAAFQDCDITTMSGKIYIDGEPARDARIRAKAQLNGSIELHLPREVEGLFTITCPSSGMDLSSFKPLSPLTWNFRDGNRGEEKDETAGENETRFDFSLPFGDFMFERNPGSRTGKHFDFSMPRIQLFESRTNEFSVGTGKLRVYLETGILDMRELRKENKGDAKAVVTLVTK